MDGEEKLINPDLWGKRLADFLREGLRQQGFETQEPIAEDWGWAIPVVNKLTSHSGYGSDAATTKNTRMDFFASLNRTSHSCGGG